MSAINAMILLTTSSLELHDIVPVWKAKENTPIRFQGFLHPQRPRACLIASHEFACPTCQQEAKLRATMMIEEHGYLASSSYVTFRFSAEHNEFGVRALSNRKTLASRLDPNCLEKCVAGCWVLAFERGWQYSHDAAGNTPRIFGFGFPARVFAT